MKNLFVILCFVLGMASLKGQNLVNNPSFEVYDTCPNNISQINRASGWYVTRNSPDYFNGCSIDTFSSGQFIVSVPLNWAGNRTAASGNAYAGAITSWASSEDREHIGSSLITPLLIGTKYFASLKISLGGQAAGTNYCGTNKFGILFSTIHYDSVHPTPICSNCAQVYSDSIVTDTLNWTRLTGSFVADSNYSFISIGRFNLNSLTNFTQVSGGGHNAYYFIDDVCISVDSAYAYTYSYTGINELTQMNTIDYFPNPARDWITIKGNGIQSLTLCDVLGRIVYSTNSEVISPYLLNVASISRGIYFLTAKTKSGILIKKIILN